MMPIRELVLTGFDSVALARTNKHTFSCLESNVVKLETSRTVILP